uniref:Putative secreted protein n=1 Tax=Ixodes ricinus TaxID=34613 RepID=A0A6B0UU07_IXORI
MSSLSLSELISSLRSLILAALDFLLTFLTPVNSPPLTRPLFESPKISTSVRCTAADLDTDLVGDFMPCLYRSLSASSLGFDVGLPRDNVGLLGLRSLLPMLVEPSNANVGLGPPTSSSALDLGFEVDSSCRDDAGLLEPC